MRSHPRALLSVPFVLGLLLLMGCAGDDRQALVIYSPHGKEMLGEYETLFEAENPGVDVQWLDMGGQDAYDRIRTEQQNPQASLWWGGDGPTFDRAAEEGLLTAYRPSWAEAVPDDAHHPDDFWYATYLTPEVIMFNSRTVDSTAVPRTWDDLLDPAWADRIIVRYPLASSTMRTIFGAMILRQPTVEEGYAWLARLDQNTKTYAADPTQLYLKIAREEGDITLWNMPDTYIQREINGYPFDYQLPDDGTPVLNDAIAIVRGAPSQEQAEAFYEFVTSDTALVHQAETYYRIPVRTDIDPSQLPAWMTRRAIESMDLDWRRLADEGATWMQYWDEQIKGRGAEWLAERGL